MMNNSASGGYLQPAKLALLPGRLTLNQFLQSVLVGISNFPGDLVRPDWQPEEPKQPDIGVDWMGFGVLLSKPNFQSYVSIDPEGVTTTQRHQDVELRLQIYGPNSLDNASLIQDGFQITQNLEALRSANMGFVETNEAEHMPDLVNERWVERYLMSIFLRREIQRTYPILPIVSAKGTIETVIGNQRKIFPWNSANGGN